MMNTSVFVAAIKIVSVCLNVPVDKILIALRDKDIINYEEFGTFSFYHEKHFGQPEEKPPKTKECPHCHNYMCWTSKVCPYCHKNF